MLGLSRLKKTGPKNGITPNAHAKVRLPNIFNRSENGILDVRNENQTNYQRKGYTHTLPVRTS